jgi:pilus assembly protein CpaB
MIAVSLVLALIAVVLAGRWITERASMGTNKLAVATVDINVGSRITQAAVRFTDWPAGSVPKGTFTDLKLLEGRVVRTSVMSGEPLIESKLAPVGSVGGLSAVVAEGKRAMTVRVNDVIGVAGFALPGNYVDILVSTQGEQGEVANGRDLNISKLVLERILVLAVAQEAGQGDTKPKVVNAVTLEVTPEQAETLDLARSVGLLSLMLRNQVDIKPTMTAGATKKSLLNVPVSAVKQTVATTTRKPVRALPPAAPRALNCQQVLTGSGRITQCY